MAAENSVPVQTPASTQPTQPTGATPTPPPTPSSGIDIMGLEQAAPPPIAPPPPQKGKKNGAIKITPESMGLGKPKTKIPKWAWYVGIPGLILILAGIGSFVYYYFSYPKLAKIIVTPPDALITLDGKELSAGVLSSKLMPGKHTIAARAQDYFPLTNDFLVHGIKTMTINLSLTPMPKIAKLSDELISYPDLISDGTGVDYLTKAGEELRQLLFSSGKASRLSPSILANVASVVWSANKEYLIIRIKNNISELNDAGATLVDENAPNNAVLAWIVNLPRQDVTEQKIFHLHQNIQDVRPSPAGDKLFYIFNGSGGAKVTINVSDPDGQNFNEVMSLDKILAPAKAKAQDLSLELSPDGQKIAIYSINEQKQTGLWLYDLITASLTQVGDSMTATAPKFSFSGKKLVFEDKSTTGETTLWLTDSEGAKTTDLKIVTTTNRAVWGNTDNALYFARAAKSGDGLYRLELDTNTTKMLAYQTPSAPLSISYLGFPVTTSVTKSATISKAKIDEGVAKIEATDSKTDTTAKEKTIAPPPTNALPVGLKVNTKILYFISGDKIFKLEFGQSEVVAETEAAPTATAVDEATSDATSDTTSDTTAIEPAPGDVVVEETTE